MLESKNMYQCLPSLGTSQRSHKGPGRKRLRFQRKGTSGKLVEARPAFEEAADTIGWQL